MSSRFFMVQEISCVERRKQENSLLAGADFVPNEIYCVVKQQLLVKIVLNCL